MNAFNALTVAHIKPLTSDAVKISFEIPEDLKTAYSFVPGQYVNLKTELNGATITRSYSICSLPEDSYLSIGVKRIKNGVFSTFANQDLTTGKKLSVGTPEGRFVIENTSTAAHYLAIAAGSGITPIISMISHQLAQHPETEFSLIYANQSPETVMFLEEIKQLQKQYTSRFRVQWVYSRANEAEAHFGRVEGAYLKYFLKNQKHNYHSIYLCGPELMIENLTQALQEMDYPKEHIKYELFQASDAKPEKASSGAALAQVILDEVPYEVPVEENQVVLDALLAMDIEAPYSCQGGICSSCVAKLTEGKVRLKANHVLTDQEIAEGLILTCQAIAETPKIALSFDDV